MLNIAMDNARGDEYLDINCGNVSKTLKRAGLRDKAEEFSKKAMSQKSYEDVLTLIHNYVSVC